MKKDQTCNTILVTDETNMGKIQYKRKFKFYFVKYKKLSMTFFLFLMFLLWQTIFQDSEFIFYILSKISLVMTNRVTFFHEHFVNFYA